MKLKSVLLSAVVGLLVFTSCSKKESAPKNEVATQTNAIKEEAQKAIRKVSEIATFEETFYAEMDRYIFNLKTPQQFKDSLNITIDNKFFDFSVEEGSSQEDYIVKATLKKDLLNKKKGSYFAINAQGEKTQSGFGNLVPEWK
jgi:PBP1b-binding outer membrane lipoprotein LpoB